MTGKTLFSQPARRQTLAEQMAEQIKSLILSGDLQPGDALPIEPELAQQFKVSRAVVRDATRILMAQGLVEVKHGVGVFVTPIRNPAFADALLLALRRSQATVWDVEQFYQLFLPGVVAIASQSATEDDLDRLWQEFERAQTGIAAFYRRWHGKTNVPESELTQFAEFSQRIMETICRSTHNQLVIQLAKPLLHLSSLRTWADDPITTANDAIASETGYLRQLVDVIASRDPAEAFQTATKLMCLPDKAIDVMKQTPVGTRPRIPIPLPGNDSKT